MNEDIDAITLSREYGSGGGEIASRLAKRLGWDLIDHAIVERTARELGTSQEEAEAHDEYTEGRVSIALSDPQRSPLISSKRVSVSSGHLRSRCR